jgi:hypothetical protein
LQPFQRRKSAAYDCGHSAIESPHFIISKAFGLINIGFEKEGKVIFAVVHAEHLWYTVDRSFQKPADAAKAAQNQTFRKD